MDIFKVIFKNSIIYKIFMYLLVLYNNSYLKKFCTFLAKVYYDSKIYVGVSNYINSTPLYKYSLIKRLNECIYLFVVKHSKFLYNFVGKTFNNSRVVILCQNQYESAKQDTLKSISFFVAMFMFGFSVARMYLYGLGTIEIAILALGIIALVAFFASSAIKRVFFGSFTYNLVDKLLKMEVSSEQD